VLGAVAVRGHSGRTQEPGVVTGSWSTSGHSAVSSGDRPRPSGSAGSRRSPLRSAIGDFRLRFDGAASPSCLDVSVTDVVVGLNVNVEASRLRRGLRVLACGTASVPTSAHSAGDGGQGWASSVSLACPFLKAELLLRPMPSSGDTTSVQPPGHDRQSPSPGLVGHGDTPASRVAL
jgi:hypothetical protein